MRNVIIIHVLIFFADCGTCCENIEIESTNPDTIYTRITGSYECYVDFYGKNVYKKHGDEMYLYWMYIKNIIGNVSDMATTGRWMVIFTYIVCPYNWDFSNHTCWSTRCLPIYSFLGVLGPMRDQGFILLAIHSAQKNATENSAMNGEPPEPLLVTIQGMKCEVIGINGMRTNLWMSNVVRIGHGKGDPDVWKNCSKI